MSWPRVSIRGLMLALLVLGYDMAALGRAWRMGQLEGDAAGYLRNFGLVLLALNLMVFALAGYFVRRARLSRDQRRFSAVNPLVMLGLYLTLLSFAVLSVLFVTSGRF